MATSQVNREKVRPGWWVGCGGDRVSCGETRGSFEFFKGRNDSVSLAYIKPFFNFFHFSFLFFLFQLLERGALSLSKMETAGGPLPPLLPPSSSFSGELPARKRPRSIDRNLLVPDLASLLPKSKRFFTNMQKSDSKNNFFLDYFCFRR